MKRGKGAFRHFISRCRKLEVMPLQLEVRIHNLTFVHPIMSVVTNKNETKIFSRDAVLAMHMKSKKGGSIEKINTPVEPKSTIEYRKLMEVKNWRRRELAQGLNDETKMRCDKTAFAEKGETCNKVRPRNEVKPMGRFLQGSSAYVPPSSVCFEMNISHNSKLRNAQPFVIQAPFTLWGNGNDAMLRAAADEGSPMVDARRYEPLWNEFSESIVLLPKCYIYIDRPKLRGLRAKRRREAAINFLHTIQAFFLESVDTVAYPIVLIGNYLTRAKTEVQEEDEVDNRTHVSDFTIGTSDTQLTKMVNKLATTCNSRIYLDDQKPHGRVPGDRHNGETLISKYSVGDFHDEVKMDTESELMGIAKGADNEDNIKFLGDNNARADLQSTETKATYLADWVSSTKSPIQTKLEFHSYDVMKDAHILFRIVQFPDREVLGEWSISVGTVLNQRPMEERLSHPHRSSELTTTFVQEPTDTKWGIQCTATVQCSSIS